MFSRSTHVAQARGQREFPCRILVQPGPVKSLEQAAQERGQQPEQIIRSLLFRLSKEDFVMALMAGPQQVNWKILRRKLGEKRLTTASEEEVLRGTTVMLSSAGLRQALPPFELVNLRA